MTAPYPYTFRSQTRWLQQPCIGCIQSEPKKARTARTQISLSLRVPVE